MSSRNRRILEHRVDLLAGSLSHGLGKVAATFVRDALIGMEVAHSPISPVH